MKNNTFLFVLIFGLMSCIMSCDISDPCTLTEQKENEISSEIITILNDFFNPETLDYKKHLSLRANDENYLYAGDGTFVFNSYEDYKAGVKSAFDEMQGWVDLKMTKSHVYVLSMDAASATVEFEGAFVNLNGDTITNNGCWTFVFKKFNNDWKVVQENGTHIH